MLQGCESITRQDFCEEMIRPDCVWKDGYPRHLDLALDVVSEAFVAGEHLEDGDSVNLVTMMMIFGVLLVVFALYGCRKYLRQKDAKCDDDEYSRLNAKGYGTYQASI